MSQRKRLLVVYHTQSGNTGRLAVADAVIVRKLVTDDALAQCEELGEAIASGLSLGFF